VPPGPRPGRARTLLARLEEVRATVGEGEDDILACLVVTGEPRPQRVVDDWLDQVADALQAIGETAGELAPVLARHAGQVPRAETGQADPVAGRGTEAVEP
jgi:hypothetical protein